MIGRGNECGILLFDQKCSRAHCQIIRKGRHYAVEDLDSRNGTLLNDKRIKSGKAISLSVGDQIRIGKTVLLFSDKGMGGVVEQTASDVAADLQRSKFSRLMTDASVKATSALMETQASLQKRRGLISRIGAFLKRPLF